MEEEGYFAYRYKRKYYRRSLEYDASPYDSGCGRRLANMVPRDPSALKDWVANRITMLENAKICETKGFFDDVVHPNDGLGADDFGFNVFYEPDLWWRRSSERSISWTYTIDLDNLVFTINGIVHLRLDNMPPDLEDYTYQVDGDAPVPQEYLRPKVDLWPSPGFDIEERQQKYKALQPMIVPATEWGAPTWDELTVSQRFSIEITHHLLRETSPIFAYAYVPFIRGGIGRFCWNVLCASVPALPMSRVIARKGEAQFRTLSCGSTNSPWSLGAYLKMHSLEFANPFKVSGGDYCWIRGCLIAFCTHLDDPIYVAHEVEQMVHKMRSDGHSEAVGIILSSQQELVVVAVDGPTVRHSPVLDIRTTPCGERPGRATEGRLLLTYLLSPPVTVPPLPWRTRPRQPLTVSRTLPPEILRTIIGYLDIRTYLTMCQVSRSIRSVCVANPRIGDYTVLRRVQGFMSMFAVRSRNGKLKNIKLQWDDGQWKQWRAQEVSPEEFDKLKQEENTEKVFDVIMYSFHCTW
ncbi:unnamed protein product [Rhizoctonia solani]|uniref:F-box domain-containing protein n=1 Tax=Rhizoctonia solani TaxID=456999 RepID=A0A8H3HMC3_9AGAM|nr:unnamed protein product [Rhizoctonia solani]